MELDPDIHIAMHSVLFLKPGVIIVKNMGHRIFLDDMVPLGQAAINVVGHNDCSAATLSAFTN